MIVTEKYKNLRTRVFACRLLNVAGKTSDMSGVQSMLL